MPGEATVTIGGSTWTVEIASSAAELQAGLSGVASIPANTGILFDMGSAQDIININMADMLFKLDIVFISSAGVVVGILRDVAPGDNAAFDAGNGLGARYFLEVNEDEMSNVSIGDTVVIEVTDTGTTNGVLDLNAIISPLITIMIIGMMMKVMAEPLKAPVKKPLIYGPKGEILT